METEDKIWGKESYIAGQGEDGVDLVRFKEGFPGFESRLRVQWNPHFCRSRKCTLKNQEVFSLPTSSLRQFF